MRHYIKLHEDDNVIVALTDLESGSTLTINGEPLIVKENIKQGHKIAISKISNNDFIIKYGYPIGHALKEIEPGTHVHTHNIKTNLNDCLSYEYQPNLKPDINEKIGRSEFEMNFGLSQPLDVSIKRPKSLKMSF